MERILAVSVVATLWSASGCKESCSDLAEQYAEENTLERAVLDTCDPSEADACSLLLPTVVWEVPDGVTVSNQLTPQQQGLKLQGLSACMRPHSPSRSARLAKIYGDFEAKGCQLAPTPCPLPPSNGWVCGQYNAGYACVANTSAE